MECGIWGEDELGLVVMSPRSNYLPMQADWSHVENRPVGMVLEGCLCLLDGYLAGVTAFRRGEEREKQLEILQWYSVVCNSLIVNKISSCYKTPDPTLKITSCVPTDDSLSSNSTESLEGLINIFKDDDVSEEIDVKSDREDTATTPQDLGSALHACDSALDLQEDLVQDLLPAAGASKEPPLDGGVKARGSTIEDQGSHQPQLTGAVPEASATHTQQMLEQTIHLLHEAVQNFHVTVQSGYTQMHSDMTRSHTIMQFGWTQFTEQVGCLVSLLRTLVQDHQAPTPQLRDVAVQSSVKSPEGQSTGEVLPAANSPVADVVSNVQCNPVEAHLNDESSQSSATCPSVNRTHVHSFNI